MKLPIAYYGNPILRKKCQPVQEITPEIKEFIADMIETMHAQNGIGLAAPQVHRSISIFITEAPVLNEKQEWQNGVLRVFINPKILEVSREEWTCSEGCLSIPKLYCDISRPLRVRVQATNLEGELFEGEYFGLEAHAVLHENDHINGVLFIDRIHGKKRKEMEPILKLIKKQYAENTKPQ